jgi:hypothetical protein
MRVSIQAADNIIIIDGKILTVNCSTLRSRNISAVQWYDELGEVEFKDHKQANQAIRSIKEFQSLIDEAKPLADPKAQTPDELDAQHRAYMERNPDARRAWDERDAALKRESEMRKAEQQKAAEALASGATDAKPLPGAPPFTGLPDPPQPQSPMQPETGTKPKMKPKKK